MAAREPLSGVDWAETFGMLAHDIRNPLATIKNSAYYLTSRLAAGPKDEKVSKHLRMIDSEVNRANAMLERLTAFFKPRTIEPRGLPLNDWIERLLREAELPASIKVRENLASPGPTALADAGQLQVAFKELLANAVEAMPAGGELQVRTVNDGGAVIELQDAGSGIDPSIRAVLFTPFKTSKQRHWGLGLATARRIAELHGGTLTLEPGPKGGAVARLSIKAVPA